jgi:type I restriction enzyme M protein
MELGQYYTPEIFSTLLVESMISINADSILDIGCGQASLLSAARKRWNQAKLIGYDIDPKNYNVTGRNLHIEFGNGFDADLSQKILDAFGHIDISVSNPPFTHVEINYEISQILKLSRLFECIPKSIKKIPAEIVFLAQNILVLKTGGELGAILPASIISGEKWKGLREFLVTEKSLDKVIQLPNKAFNNTEAATFAVNFKNIKSQNNNINLFSFEDNCELEIDKKSGIKRLDYYYHSHCSNKNNIPLPPEVVIFRGNKSSKLLREASGSFLHTSSLKEQFQLLQFKNNNYPEGTKVASKGDFVISRVGSRCIGKTGFIQSGNIEVSDCITVVKNLRFKNYISYFKKGLFFKEISHNALGTGAKYLTFDIIKEALEAI